MAQGQHKGARVVLTLDRDVYARWKGYAAALGIPTATLLREILELNEPTMEGLVANLEALKADDKTIEEVLGPILLRTLIKVGQQT